ncbi:MAG TPA: GNAT family N-acetyltransferase [Anaerolineales bacterium]|nr:GNAT family N-acetyltransferase [Anaerolineales bacterium]
MEKIIDPRLKVLETERLILRRFVPADAALILELLNEPSFIQNIGDRGVRTLSDAERYIETGPAASYASNGFGLYLVQVTDSHESIGMCGLIKRDSLEDVDLGYAFLPRFWSKGYAIESVLAVMEFAKNTVHLERVVAIVDPKNQGSIRVLEKAGFKFEKMIRLSADDIELRLFAIEI